MRRVKGKQDARCAAGAARLHQQELEELRTENEKLKKLLTPRSKEIARLRSALSSIGFSHVLDRDDFTLAHLMREAQRIARDALKGG